MSLHRSIVSRRDSLWMGSFATLGLCAGGPAEEPQPGPSGTRTFGRAKRCVLVWLDGGPSHLETLDPKPEASAEVRGPLRTIPTKLPGIRFGEGMPELANRLDRFAIIRSMTSPVGEHNLATQYALSGHVPGGRAAAPAFMLPAATHLKSAGALPVHIAVPNFQLGGGSKLQGYLDESSLPWSLNAEPSGSDFAQRIGTRSSHVSETQLARRRALLQPSSSQNSRALVAAIDLMRDAQSQRVLDLELESSAMRARYGLKSIGQCCLLARRLLESGVPLVTVNNVGWDTHDRLHERLHAGYAGAKIPVGLVPSLDQAVAALLDDLQASGLLDETLVIVMGEFGRTPKINAQGGRDHWPRAYSVLLAGAGVSRGLIYGQTDRVGEVPVENPVSPADLVATMYHLLGLEPHARQTTPDGQQLARVPEQARVVHEILV